MLVRDLGSETGWTPMELPVLATNAVLNPDFEFDLVGWGPYGSSYQYGRTAGDAYVGAACLELHPGTGTTGYIGVQTVTDAEGEQRFTAQLKRVAGVGAFNVLAEFKNSSNQTVGSQLWSPDLPLGEWVPFDEVITVPQGLERVVLAFRYTSYQIAVDVMRIDQVCEAPRVPYFDGGTPGCRWTGAPHASTSEKLLPSAADLA